MKKIYFLSILGLTVFASCEKELELKPISESTTETFYASQNDFLQGVNAVYSRLRTYPDRLLNLSETRSDNLYAVSEGGVRDWDGINNFQKTIANNPYISEAWLNNFNGIARANVLLDQLEKKGSVISNTTFRNRLEAEARFLRAFYYFDLVRYFGKVPLIDKPVSANEVIAIPRAPVSEVYTLIMNDLKFASENLSESYTGTDIGRATKYAAKGLLALVHMTRSGPTYGIDGPGLGVNEWAQALTLLNEVIASNKYSFLPSYSSIFSYTNENNKEVVFDVQYISGGIGQGATFAVILTPDQYFNALGLPNQHGTYIRPVSNNMLNSYPAGDKRKQFSIVQGYTYQGATETRSYLVKYVDVTKYGKDRLDWPINFIAMRFTDILLLKAEAILNGAPGSQADADAIVNMVRNRAGIENISNVTKEQLFEERRREFIGEGLRWHDLVRSGMVETKINSWKQQDDALNQIQPFQKNFILYPLPQSELDVRQGLYNQNPGY